MTVRFTTRRLMVIVAASALLLGAEATRRRWASFRAMAAEMARYEAQCRDMAASMRWASERGPESDREEMKGKAKEYKRLADELSQGKARLERQW